MGTAMRIFNFKQANFLFKEGCTIINMGYSVETGNPYVRFLADELFHQKMKEWQTRCREMVR